ncbi:MAG: hypothetical protein UMV23_03720 [Halanaerobium sp.]|nr:hypothetical protein [Halanaerobium sp.]
MNNITTKELYYIKDHLSWELLAAKKCNEYARQTVDPEMRSIFTDLGHKHQQHYQALLQQL